MAFDAALGAVWQGYTAAHSLLIQCEVFPNRSSQFEMVIHHPLCVNEALVILDGAELGGLVTSRQQPRDVEQTSTHWL